MDEQLLSVLGTVGAAVGSWWLRGRYDRYVERMRKGFVVALLTEHVEMTTLELRKAGATIRVYAQLLELEDEGLAVRRLSMGDPLRGGMSTYHWRLSTANGAST